LVLKKTNLQTHPLSYPLHQVYLNRLLEWITGVQIQISKGIGRHRQGAGYRETLTEEEEFKLSENRLEGITKEIEGEDG
jgi:hypothetical protein